MPANSNRDEYGWGLLTGLRSWRVVLMAVTLLGALRRHGKKRGVASLCIGGGEATAMAIERV